MKIGRRTARYMDPTITSSLLFLRNDRQRRSANPSKIANEAHDAVVKPTKNDAIDIFGP